MLGLLKFNDLASLNMVEQYEKRECDENIIVTAPDGTRYEIARYCPHAGASLDDAPIEGHTITCLNHHYIFDLDTGECLTGNCTLRTKKLELNRASSIRRARLRRSRIALNHQRFPSRQNTSRHAIINVGVAVSFLPIAARALGSPFSFSRPMAEKSPLPAEASVPTASADEAARYRYAFIDAKRWLQSRLDRMTTIHSWMLSLGLHCTIIIALGLLIQHVQKHAEQVEMSVHTIDAPAALENLPLPHDPTARPGDGGDSPVAGFGNLASGPPGQDEAPIGNPNLGSTVPYIVPSAPSPDGHAVGKLDPLASLVRSESNSGAWGMPVAKGGGGLGGRTPGMCAKLAGERGGSRESEAAVERGLKWLLAHQHEDGSWHFNFDGPPCDGLCRNPGTEASTTAATALALLPFYGAGYTHKDGPYNEQVNKGLYYLASRMLISPNGGDLEEGTMYAQGLSTIVLCEAYNMSKDDKLRQFAQSAINFIVYAQDKQGGGWRYFPQSPGDTSVTGWQLMALKSGQMAGSKFPRKRSFSPTSS